MDNQHSVYKRLMDTSWEARRQAGLPVEHCRSPAEMGFPANTAALREFLGAGGGASHLGMGAFIHGRLMDAQRHWVSCLESARQQKNVLATVNFDPAFHAALTNFEGWPAVQTEGLGKRRPKTCFVACDGVYWENYGAALVESIRDTSSLAVHVHLMDPGPAVLEAAKATRLEGLTWEHPGAGRGYYHAVRFVRFRQLLSHYRELLLLDADQIANKDLTPLFCAEPFGVRMRPCRIEPWNQINASAVFARSEPEALAYFTRVAAYLTHYRNQLFWGIDQMALYAVWAAGCQPCVHCYSQDELDYYYGDGLLWVNSGVSKHSGSTDRPAFMDKFKVYQARTNTPEGLAMRGAAAMRAGDMAEAQTAFRSSFDATVARENFPVRITTDIPKAKHIGRFVYLPIENAARELQHKAALAGDLARLGYQVMIGATWMMMEGRFQDLPPGMVLFKTMNAFDAHNLFYAKQAGHLTACLNEEMYGLDPVRWVYDAEIAPYCARNMDLVCAQNQAQADLYGEMGMAWAVTGTPRASVYVAKSGSKIIVCTMAGFTNNLLPFKNYVAACLQSYGGKTDDMQRLVWEQIEHEITTAPLMRGVLESLPQSYPGKHVIIRAHPSEDPEFYRPYLQPLNEAGHGVTLDDRTPFTERLRDAALVVFVSGCTTGFEARMAGIPTLRIGSGGHGVSARDETPAFPPCVLAETLRDFAEQSVGFMDLDLATILPHREALSRPAAFHENKFPAADISGMVGAGVKVTEVGWRQWVVQNV